MWGVGKGREGRGKRVEGVNMVKREGLPSRTYMWVQACG